MEIGYGETTEPLDDGIFSSTKKRLIFLVIEAEVTNHHDGLMKQLLAIFLLVRSLNSIMKNIVE